MEEKLIDRIGDEYLNGNFQDGQILLNSDVNEIVSIVKEGINANFNDIQKIQNGSHQVGNAKQLDGADLSRFSDGEMVGSDKLIPTSQQVKSYVDSKVQEIKDTTEVGKLVEDLNELSINVENKIDKEDLVNEETTGTDKAYNCDYINELFENGVGDSLPIGTIVEYTGENIPDGFEEVIEPEDATVYVGPTEPTGGQDVWIQKGKNLFDKNSTIKGEAYGQEGVLVINALWSRTSFIKVHPNTIYSYSSKLISGKSEIQTTLSYWNSNKVWIGEKYTTNLIETITTPADCEYIIVQYRNDTLENIQLEQGSTATEYEPYIPKRVFVKNDNGGYEKFYDEEKLEVYSTSEQRIGTWIDGRPIYKKVVVYHNSETIGTSNGTVTVNVPHEIANLGLVIDHKILNRDNYIVPLVTGNNNGGFQNTTGIFRISDTNIQLRITNDTWSETDWFFILKYIKNN